MNEQDFQAKLSDLLTQIDELPADQRDELTKLAEETKLRRAKMQATIKGLQESLDHLRLSVKYLVFDLEATRRENAYLRQLLDAGEADAESDDNA